MVAMRGRVLCADEETVGFLVQYPGSSLRWKHALVAPRMLEAPPHLP